jgi:hypothetical protein
MAFQTNVFRDGEWVTETVNLHAVLKSQKAGPKGPAKQDPLKPPRCGLLTRTLIESAQANLILPVRLRSPDYNDIAFVGVGLPNSLGVCRGCHCFCSYAADPALMPTRTTLSKSASFGETDA